MDPTDKQIARLDESVRALASHQILRVVVKTVNAMNSAFQISEKAGDKYLANLTQIQKDALQEFLGAAIRNGLELNDRVFAGFARIGVHLTR